jgi:hypothetical protein
MKLLAAFSIAHGCNGFINIPQPGIYRDVIGARFTSSPNSRTRSL